jgi:hypothetical protein
MAPHLLFIAPPATLLATETRSSNDPLSRVVIGCALQFDDGPLRQIVGIGALAGWKDSLVLVQYLARGTLAPLRVPHLSCSAFL